MGVRVASALLLAPPILVVLYFGPPTSDVLVLAAGGIAAWEWARVCGRGAVDAAGGAAIAAVVATVAAGALGQYPVAAWIVAVGAMGATLWATRTRRADAVWLGLGVVYLAVGCLAFLWLRRDPESGRVVVFWLIAVVWGTDIGAYFTGRTLGGPRLAPSISPKKTWSGLIGGAMMAAAVGVAVAAWRGSGELLHLAALSVALALVAQVGDLFESSLKRQFGVKDSSGLIPGHGGLLDRIDGLLAGALLIGGLSWLAGTTI